MTPKYHCSVTGFVDGTDIGCYALERCFSGIAKFDNVKTSKTTARPLVFGALSLTGKPRSRCRPWAQAVC